VRHLHSDLADHQPDFNALIASRISRQSPNAASIIESERGQHPEWGWLIHDEKGAKRPIVDQLVAQRKARADLSGPGSSRRGTPPSLFRYFLYAATESRRLIPEYIKVRITRFSMSWYRRGHPTLDRPSYFRIEPSALESIPLIFVSAENFVVQMKSWMEVLLLKVAVAHCETRAQASHLSDLWS